MSIMSTEQVEEELNSYLLHLQSDLLLIGDTVMTDRHADSTRGGNRVDYGTRRSDHPSGDKFPQNTISGIIPSFSLSGWLRHGMETVLINKGITVCHPGESSANFQRAEVYERDLDSGYHEKGDCENNPCLIANIYGGFENQPGILMRKPIRFTPVRSHADFNNGEAEAHYRRLTRQVTSRNQNDNRVPFRSAEIDALANLDGTWKLVYRNTKKPYIGLLVETATYLNENKENFMHQLGGSKNFGGGIVNTSLINPLYDDKDVSRYFDRSTTTKTNKMKQKDTQWRDIKQETRGALNEWIEEHKELTN